MFINFNNGAIVKQVLPYFNLLLTLLIVFTRTVFSQSGWVRQYPPPQAQNIGFLSVSFVNADTGFVVGGYGTILHTTNGGTNWVIQIKRNYEVAPGIFCFRSQHSNCCWRFGHYSPHNKRRRSVGTLNQAGQYTISVHSRLSMRDTGTVCWRFRYNSSYNQRGRGVEESI